MFAGLGYHPALRLNFAKDSNTESIESEAANLIFGLTLTPRLLIGSELFGMAARVRSEQVRDDDGTETFIQLAAGPCLIYFPLKSGPYLKASVYGNTLDDWDVESASPTNTQEKVYGFGAGIGGGYSFGFGRAVNLNLELNAGVAKFDTDRTNVRFYSTLGVGVFRY